MVPPSDKLFIPDRAATEQLDDWTKGYANVDPMVLRQITAFAAMAYLKLANWKDIYGKERKKYIDHWEQCRSALQKHIGKDPVADGEVLDRMKKDLHACGFGEGPMFDLDADELARDDRNV